jgi:FKBP-type peptidyl-prolyl cis-trans isomerase
MQFLIRLLRNPIIRACGVAAVLYFALFADKKNPESLGNRLSAENVKKNLGDMTEKGKFIAVNVRTARDMAKNMKDQPIENKVNTFTGIKVSDLTKGEGEKANCSDEVNVDYGLYGTKGKQLYFNSSEKFILGQKKDWLLEKHIIGMQKGTVRSLIIPQTFDTDDEKLKQYLITNKNGVEFKITLNEIKPIKTSTTPDCNY